MECVAMKDRCAGSVQEGVGRPAAWSSRVRNQGGMGCVWVSMRVAVEKSGVGVRVAVESWDMESRASVWKGRVVRSMESRRAAVWMRVVRGDMESAGGVESAIVGCKRSNFRVFACLFCGLLNEESNSFDLNKINFTRKRGIWFFGIWPI